MDPARWLVKSAPGFDLLSAQERKAIRDFALLWSLYEGRVLDTAGSADAIIQAVGSLKRRDKLTLKPLHAAITHFSARYYDGADLTPDFFGLHLRANDHQALVEKMVRGLSSDDAEILSAVLIIVLRLRNNLFHGAKWVYGLRGQLGNFRNANDVLMSVIDMHRS
jgi:hypothetical protein